MLALCLLVGAIEAVEDKNEREQQVSTFQQQQPSEVAKIDKLPVAKKKLQQAKMGEVSIGKLRVTRSLNDSSQKLGSRKTTPLDLMTAAHEKKYMLVKKKPKHKKIKMEVFKPKMKYKKIKMKIPVKKMKKKKVKGYLVKKEHGHHEY